MPNESTDAPRAGGETPMIDPKRIAADAVQRLSDSEPDEDAIAAMDRLAGTPQESMFCVSAPVLERVIEVAVADALFDASRVSLLERHRDGERLDRTLRNLRAACVTENPEWGADDTAVIGIRVTRDFYDKTMSSTTPASPPAASEPTEGASND